MSTLHATVHGSGVSRTSLSSTTAWLCWDELLPALQAIIDAAGVARIYNDGGVPLYYREVMQAGTDVADDTSAVLPPGAIVDVILNGYDSISLLAASGTGSVRVWAVFIPPTPPVPVRSRKYHGMDHHDSPTAVSPLPYTWPPDAWVE